MYCVKPENRGLEVDRPGPSAPTPGETSYLGLCPASVEGIISSLKLTGATRCHTVGRLPPPDFSRLSYVKCGVRNSFLKSTQRALLPGLLEHPQVHCW